MSRAALNKQIAAQLLERDGTYSMTGDPQRFSVGFQVGGFAPASINPTLREATQWVALVRSIPDVVGDRFGPLYLGSWTDENGNVFLDACYLFLNRSLALEQARFNGERAIWDWARMTAEEVTAL